MTSFYSACKWLRLRRTWSVTGGTALMHSWVEGMEQLFIDKWPTAGRKQCRRKLTWGPTEEEGPTGEEGPTEVSCLWGKMNECSLPASQPAHAAQTLENGKEQKKKEKRHWALLTKDTLHTVRSPTSVVCVPLTGLSSAIFVFFSSCIGPILIFLSLSTTAIATLAPPLHTPWYPYFHPILDEISTWMNEESQPSRPSHMMHFMRGATVFHSNSLKLPNSLKMTSRGPLQTCHVVIFNGLGVSTSVGGELWLSLLFPTIVSL